MGHTAFPHAVEGKPGMAGASVSAKDHLSLVSTGQATVVDLPSGWTLQWRARMVLQYR